jgi:tRNA (guanine6-N2)-methyltransferase
LRISAAGSESAVLVRLRQQLAGALALTSANDRGDLHLALRRTADSGWEVLVRTTPRPLSARRWRVCDLPGALNATAASVMATLGQPRATERFVNVCCGSGTLMIERLALGAAARVVGYDIDPAAQACAEANARASGYRDRMDILTDDATALPVDAASIDTVVADLPYAMRMGSSADNTRLYPALLAEAARVTVPRGRLVVVTTQRQLIERVLGASDAWRPVETVPFRVPHSGGWITPRIYALERL